MTPLEDRLQRVEADIARLSPSLNERLGRLEVAVKAAGQAVTSPAPPSPFSRIVSWLGSELPKFIFGVALLWITWGLKDSVDIAIKQRQLDLSYAKEMQGLLQTMGARDADKEKLTSTAIVMASFGEGSVPALLSELRQGNLRTQAAVSGLELLTLTHSEALCNWLPRVLASRAKLFDTQAHKDVVRLLGVNRCAVAEPQLRQYKVLVTQAIGGKDAQLVEFLRDRPESPNEEYAFMLEAVDEALKQLSDAATSQSKFLGLFR